MKERKRMGTAASTFEAECHPPATRATGNSVDKWKSGVQLSHSRRHLAAISPPSRPNRRNVLVSRSGSGGKGDHKRCITARPA